MATFRKKDEKLVQCPYNPVHMMKPSSYQAHIAKCIKDHPDQDFKTCPYNAQHRFPGNELHIHVTSCPDRAIVDRQILNTATDCRGTTNVPSYSNNVPQLNEYWDEDCREGPGYDPKKNLENRIIFRDTTYWKPLEKRNYYKSLFQQNGIAPVPPSPEIGGFRPSSSNSNHSQPKPEKVPQSEPEVMKSVSNINLNVGMGRGMPTSSRLAARFSGGLTPISSSSLPQPEREIMGRGQGIIKFHELMKKNPQPGTFGQIKD